MFEALVVATATTGLFALAWGVKANERYTIDERLVISIHDERGDDLPCPWCYSPTEERDNRCNSCGRTFG